MPGKKGMKRRPATPETRAKCRAAKLGKKLSDEHKAKISRSLLGNQYRKGIPHTMETRLHLQSTSRRGTVETRFWAKVEKTEACWIWIGGIFRNGYGRFGIRSRIEGMRKDALAHRVSYEWAYGPIPEGLLVCHRCDNPRCVNPEHLFLGTYQDNMNDMMDKDRARPAKGEGSGHHVLTDTQIPVIRAQYASGVSIAEIARRFPVGAAAISKIVHGKTWRHIPR